MNTTGQDEQQESSLRTAWLGRVRYRPTLELQRKLFEQRKTGAAPDTLLLLEHEHVYTLGRRADRADVLMETPALSAIGAEVVETDRGGEVTYHGPGQLVMYPIVSIREMGHGPVSYVRMLEETVIRVLAGFGIEGHRVVGKTGVWVGGKPGNRPEAGQNPAGRKIAAMGVRVSGGVAMHGLALNVSPDLSYFGHIVPCGMAHLDVTSIARETSQRPGVESVGHTAAETLGELLQRRIESWTPEQIPA